MRTLSKPSTAKCTVEHYAAFLLAEPQSAGCVRLAEVAGGAPMMRPTDSSTARRRRHETESIPLTEYCRVVLGRRRGARRLEDIQRVVAAAVG